MNVLTYDMIDKSWHEMDTMELEDIPKLVDTLGREQPYILAYLMATGSDILNQKERESLLFMGVMIWHLVLLTQKSIPEISASLLDKKESKNIRMLEYLAGEPETDFMSTVDSIMRNYHQAELLRYVIDKVVEDSRDGMSVTDENIGMFVMYLKTVIDCIDSVI